MFKPNIRTAQRLRFATSTPHFVILRRVSRVVSQSGRQSFTTLRTDRPSNSFPKTNLSNLPSQHPREMTTSNHEDPAIKDVLDYWFGMSLQDWFQNSSKHDKTITERFGHLVEKARLTDELDDLWLSTPSGNLAMIILLDQFTRNIYRPGNHSNPGLSWSGDAKALRIAAQSIAKGYDIQVQEEYSSHSALGWHHRHFFYLPFMHAEDLPSQTACVALFEKMQGEIEINRLQKELKGEKETEQEQALREFLKMAVPFAKRHRDCIAAVSRFPMRNKHLGRENTEADEKFLKEHPQGF